MKLRRALVTAAATAAIAPIALLSAPAAFADVDTTNTTVETSPSASETSSPAETPETSPSESSPAATPPKTDEPSASASATTTPSASVSAPESTPASPSASESDEPTDEPTDGPIDECEDSKVDVSITGLPGKIARGSGWHKFSLNVANNSDSTLSDLGFFAGASSDAAGEDLFASKKVSLQAYDPESKTWQDVSEDGYAVGYVGYTDTLEPDYEVNIPMRVNVTSAAPVGAAFSLGASIYGDADAECTGYGEVAYKFQIVGAGTDTDGTKPQEGGKVPVTTKPADKTTTPAVDGSLAATGSNSMLPTVGLVGGIAVVAGAGVVYSVRRRKVSTEA
ncbi:hypothetical protein ACIBL6_28530 [Streptomyces sp. NPDC050400]|uniref:hypothetical protein n=1 Tax=Streptomyces sp. NPDC050400 TaxID=3365610 RepID=UPI0037BB56EA